MTAENKAIDGEHEQTVALFDDINTGETVGVVGKIVGRDERRSGRRERVVVESVDGDEYTFYMGDTYQTRRVKKNRETIGHWTAFLD